MKFRAKIDYRTFEKRLKIKAGEEFEVEYFFLEESTLFCQIIPCRTPKIFASPCEIPNEFILNYCEKVN